MKKSIFGIVLYYACFAALCAADSPSVSVLQTQMRRQYADVLKKYETLQNELSARFAEQVQQGNESFRIGEFEKALSIVRSAEGKISISPSNKGVSRVWNDRDRTDYFEFRPGQENYLTGSENEIVICSGELSQNATDMTFPTRGGIGFAFRRIYLSNTKYSGPLGNGWDFSYNARIIFNNADSAKVATAILIIGGIEFKFVKSDESGWESAPGNFYQLVQEQNMYYVYDSQLSRMEFEASVERKSAFRLKALASRHGNYTRNRMTFKYQSQSDRLEEITEPYGGKISLAYNEEGRIIQIAANNKAVFYSYDNFGNLSDVATGAIAISLEKTSKMHVHYDYTSFNGRYLLNRRIDNHSRAEYRVEYDESGRVTRAGHVADDRDASWRIKYAAGKVTVIPAKPSPEIIYEFSNPDVNKDLPTKIQTPALSAQEFLEYSQSGLVIKEINALGITRNYVYDEKAAIPYLRSNLLSLETVPRDANSGKIVQKFTYAAQTPFKESVQIFECDDKGNMKQLSSYAYQYSKDWEISEVDENGIVTRYFYNKFGQLALLMDANNRAIINYYAPNWIGDPDKFSSVAGDVNGAGLLVKTVRDATRDELDKACSDLGIPNFIFNDILRVQPVSVVSLFAYDKCGNVIFLRKGDEINLTLYNRFGDPLASYSSGKGIEIIEWSDDFRKSSIKHLFEPVPNGFQGEASNHFTGRFYTEAFTYDSMGYISSHSKTNEEFDGKRSTFTYQRNSNGTIQQVTDPSGLARIDFYNPMGLLCKQRLHGGNSQVILSSDFEYFPDGNIKSFKNAIGDKTSYRLDAYGRIAETNTADGNTVTKRFDGIGRVLSITTTNNNAVVAMQEYTYCSNGMPDSQFDYLITDGKSEKIETKRVIYDAAGNIIAERNAHKDGWSVHLLDGLNRIVATMLPDGDIKSSVYSNDEMVMDVLLNKIDSKKYRPSGTIMLLNSAGQICVSAQVSADWETVMDKSRIFSYSPSGIMISALNPGQTEFRKYCNTLGLIVREENIPQKRTFGETNIVTDYEYTASGQLKRKSLQNTALMIIGSEDSAKAEQISVPQTTIYSYDELARQLSIQQPDGLIVEKKYNEQSMPVAMLWRHATEPEKILRHIKLDYGTMGRLVSITDLLTDKVQRSYLYDVYGNCIQATDLSGNTPVATHRKFNSLGLLVEESTYYGKTRLPGYEVECDMRNGIEVLQWNNLPLKSPLNWHKQTTRKDALGRVMDITLDDSNVEFASWKYRGLLPLERKIPESLVTTRYTYSQWDELIRTEFLDKSTPYGKLSYDYDSHGNMLFSATSLATDAINHYSFAQYMDYNSFRQLVAQNGESVIPSDDQIKVRWQHVLHGKESIQAMKTSRNVYDQAENIWAIYNGDLQQKLLPDTFTQDNLSQFLSPGSIVKTADKLTSKELFELASNRDTTQAKFSGNGKLTAEENVYDLLGNLQEFKGEFWNGERTFQVNWHLKFDTMGRLTSMTGIADSEYPFVKKGQLTAELFFEYDAENRRIRKSVKDYSRPSITIQNQEFTVFCGNNQAMILRDAIAGMTIQEQYLWNANTRELLMAALPENRAENNHSAETARYYFQQDKSLNTICVTKSVNGRIDLVTGASYLGFGRNATSARIIEVISSMHNEEKNESASFNQQLDDNKISSWKNTADQSQYLEIKLAESNNLGNLRIWTDETFPTDFGLFVLPEGAESPGVSDLSTWVRDSVQKGFLANQVKNIVKPSAQSAVDISLNNMRGNRIVLIWDHHNEPNVNVREFEVTSIPENPGSIAFAGQWLDRETNMYYQINRYKIAGSNKFISPDPIGFLDGNNLYAYAKNNPLEWHDPDGRWAHVVLGAIGGAVINSGVYVLHWLFSEEDFSWTELGIRAVTGAAAGGVAAATFGAVNPLLAGWGVNATANAITSATAAGFTSGFASGSVDTLLHGGNVFKALKNGATSGAWGAAAGMIGGGILSQTGASFAGTLISGAAAGGITNGARSAWQAYQTTNDWGEIAWAALDGTWKGAAIGTVIAGAGWGVGRVTERIRPLEGYPKHMTDPREKGILIRTKPGEREYGGMPAVPGYQRQHIKPLSLGGRDVPGNIEYLKTELHSTNSALGGGPQNVHPGQYVNSAPLGTIFY